MDAELQRSIRDFQPNDAATHSLWHRLSRAFPLRDVLSTIPFQELSLKTLCFIAHRTLQEISRKLEQTKPIRNKFQQKRDEAYIATTFDRDQSTDQLIGSLASLFGSLDVFLQEDMNYHLKPNLDGHGYSDYYDELHITTVELGFQAVISHPETPEENAARLEQEAARKETAKQTRRERTKQRKLEKEQQELAQYERLKEKFKHKNLKVTKPR